MDHSVCRARQYYFSNLRIECCCYNFSESVNSHSFICPTAKVHLWVWKWDQNIFEVKFELLLKFKRPPIIFRNSCQISSFPPFFYAKFNLIGLNEGKSVFNLYNIKKSLLFFLNFHSVDCWLKVLYNISWNENYNFQCNFRNILAPKIVSRRLPITALPPSWYKIKFQPKPPKKYWPKMGVGRVLKLVIFVSMCIIAMFICTFENIFF